MSDAIIPSYRVRPERGGAPWRMLAIAGGVLATVAVAGAIGWSLTRSSGPRIVPVIEPDPRPVKVRPEKPGGLVVANTDQLVLEPLAVRRAAQRSTADRLAPPPETPQLDLLRREVSPAPPQAELPAPVVGAPDPPLPTAMPEPVLVAEPPPPAVALPAAAPPAVQGRALIQLAALPTEEAAKAEWARLLHRIPELASRQPIIVRFDREDGQPPVWRLRTGGLAGIAAARALCRIIKDRGAACIPASGA